MSHAVVTTRGGARAVLDEATGEVMHPVVGPLVESLRLYVEPARLEARLREGGREPLVLLDVGLGAGANALSAWRVSESMPRDARPLEILSFDRTLDALALALGHADDFAIDAHAADAVRAVLAAGAFATTRTRWRIHRGELPDALAAAPEARADIVFWDPFSPRANPELWRCAAFAALRTRCRAGCTVHTYGGATATRAALLLAGFDVGLGPVTGTDKRGTFATLPPAIPPDRLDARWFARLTRSSAPFPPDAPVDALARIARHPQFASPR
jgi:queuine tRNA-ribosyltransferase